MDITKAQDAFAALAQPTRLKAFRKLLAAHPDGLPAGEISSTCEVPHNTMSTHLTVLLSAGLVTVERDGRVMNYRADVRAFRGLIRFLASDCCNGRPEMCGDLARLVPEEVEDMKQHTLSPAFNVLFLCTQNSARSIIAEALLQKIGKGHFNAYSAGSEPAAQPMPEVIERLKALGHDVSHLAQQVVERIHRARTRRAWISSSRFATRSKARSVRTSATRP